MPDLLSQLSEPAVKLVFAEGYRTHKFTVLGNPYNKSNSREMVTLRMRNPKTGMVEKTPRLIKGRGALAYLESLQKQVRPLSPIMTKDVIFIAHIWYDSRRPDLDPSLILDALQGLIYINDRQVKQTHCFWGLDPERPRAEITCIEIPEIEPAKKSKPKPKPEPARPALMPDF